MFELGIFGGAYFKLPTSLPEAFQKATEEMLTHGTSEEKRANKYGVISGSPLEWWLAQDLINQDDPNGWVEWYVKFYYGRRHADDDKQIKRFRAFITRHLAMLRSYEARGKDSLKTKQNLLQWAWHHECDPNW